VGRRSDFEPLSPKLSSRQLVYENEYQEIYRVVADFGEYCKEYFVTSTGQRAALVATHDDNLLLVRQYRLLINRLSYEIPSGRIDRGEAPLDAARRECLEETGVDCKDLKPLSFFIPGLDTFDNPTHLFHSDKLIETCEAKIHSDEIYDHVWISLTDCLEMIRKREIVDSLSIIAILSYFVFIAREGKPRRTVVNGTGAGE
jgi:ADP-ribose diphosphatase